MLTTTAPPTGDRFLRRDVPAWTTPRSRGSDTGRKRLRPKNTVVRTTNCVMIGRLGWSKKFNYSFCKKTKIVLNIVSSIFDWCFSVSFCISFGFISYTTPRLPLAKSGHPIQWTRSSVSGCGLIGAKAELLSQSQSKIVSCWSCCRGKRYIWRPTWGSMLP